MPFNPKVAEPSNPRTPVLREYIVTSTTVSTAVSGAPTDKMWRNVMVENYTDGIVEVAFGQSTVKAFTVQQNTDKIVDNDFFYGAPYIKNNTGTGGTVIIRMWP